MVIGALAKNGSFGFAKGRLVCRAKPNVPFVRWQFYFVFMQQKFFYHSVVCFVFLQ